MRKCASNTNYTRKSKKTKVKICMEETDLKKLLNNVKDGAISIDDALLKLKEAPYEDIGFAKLDTHRGIRQGTAEVIYGAGKTKEQILDIAKKLAEKGQETVLITRMSREAADYFAEESRNVISDFTYDELSRIGIAGRQPDPNGGAGRIVVATGGTSDMPVAEEAAKTAEVLGNRVVRLYDVGVAGIHRLLDKKSLDEIMQANVIIAIAGMEGALASVIGGLADCPVIAVPTSVGYGASFNGLAALLSMLNSCASGVSVVNIDNGFGAGYLASMINKK
jgi:NCAIR mutase (PurE)-related protein